MKLILFLLILNAPIVAQQAPSIFYSDLESGPNSSGENNLGAYVSVYGKGFGATQGGSTVSVGGGSAAAYPIWSDSKITFQLGPSAATGNIVVRTSNGASNPVPFTVRAGHIYFVSTSGSDTNTGSFVSPWRTLLKARDSMQPGDITYGMDGVTQTTEDAQGWRSAMLLGTSGVAGAPIAIVAYPRATVTIGSVNGPDNGIRSKGNTAYWVLAGLNLRGTYQAVWAYGDTNWRIVGNDMTCPNGDGAKACFQTNLVNNISLYGNNVHDTGAANASALYQAVYFSTDTNHVDFGWNTIANAHGCRGLQVHSSPLHGGGSTDPTGHNQFDLSIHDNVIHDTQCDGIMFATIDPSRGAIRVYNNVIYNAGKGPNNPEGSGFWSCINVETWTNNGPTGSGTVEIFNNTMYNCGSFTSPPFGSGNAAVAYSGPNGNINVHLRNNIMNVPANLPYLLVNRPSAGLCATSDNCPWVYGSNNLFFGSGYGPANSYITNSVSQDPLLVSQSGADFHLTSGSPAAQGGTAAGQATDFDGVPLPQGGRYPIGAYALPVGVSSPAAPTVALSVSPSTTALQQGQQQTFVAAVTGTTNSSVNWSMSPSLGALTAAGVYTAPSSIASPQEVVVTATSAADPTKSASARITLNPPASTPTVAITVTPGSASVSAAQSVQLTATVSGSTNTAVTWSLGTNSGTISSSGLYTAPSTVVSQQTVQIRATSLADPTKSATSDITLLATSQAPAAAGPTVSISIQSGNLIVSFTAPSGQPASDWIGLSSINAPGWWDPFYMQTQGRTSGSMTIPLTSLPPGIYEARYYSSGTYTILARSGQSAISTQGFSVAPSSNSVVAGAPISLSWTAGPGRTSGDYIGLYPVGAATDEPVWSVAASGLASGTSNGWPAPSTRGAYELRYIIGGTYYEVAKSVSITVQ